MNNVKIKWSRYENCKGDILGNEKDIHFENQSVYWCPLKLIWCTKEDMINVEFKDLPESQINIFTNDGIAGHHKLRYI